MFEVKYQNYFINLIKFTFFFGKLNNVAPTLFKAHLYSASYLLVFFQAHFF